MKKSIMIYDTLTYWTQAYLKKCFVSHNPTDPVKTGPIFAFFQGQVNFSFFLILWNFEF